MDLYGSLADNLQAAVESVRRHRGHPVHAETVKFWGDLLHHARALRAEGGEGSAAIEPLVAQLDLALAERHNNLNSAPPRPVRV
jgi:hypothetical protein